MEEKRSKIKRRSLKNLATPEKKKWRKDQKKKYEDTRVHLGNQLERWGEVKGQLCLKTDSEFARFLLDR